MFKQQSKIIAVDNNPDHLTLLTDKFHKNGIGCLPILYDQLNPPLNKYSNIRLAFFDINLRDITNENEIYNDLANALNDYIDTDNGPFALIFWTQNRDIINNVINYIAERRPETPRPYLINFIDKDQFLTALDDSLERALTDLLSSPTLELLLEFEDNSQNAASLAINKIYKLIPIDDQWGSYEIFTDNFRKIFSKIAIGSYGFSHAKENPDRAIYAALLPLISDNLINSAENKWKSFLIELSQRDDENEIEYPLGFEACKLNSTFHIDNIIDDRKDRRGTVLLYKHLPVYSNNQFDYIRNMYVECKRLFSMFIDFNQTHVDSNSRELIRSNSKFVAIEISSACDSSQNKPRNHNYVLGLLVPYENINIFKFDKIADAVLYKEIPEISYNNVKYKLFIHLNHTLSDFEINEKIGEPLFVFKKEIVDLIGNRYANHVSRIGITTF